MVSPLRRGTFVKQPQKYPKRPCPVVRPTGRPVLCWFVLLSRAPAHYKYSGFFAQVCQLLWPLLRAYSLRSPKRRPGLATWSNNLSESVVEFSHACILLAVLYGSCTWEILGSAGFAQIFRFANPRTAATCFFVWRRKTRWPNSKK